MERLTADVQRLEERLERELARLDERLGRAASAPAANAPPREATLPARESAQPPRAPAPALRDAPRSAGAAAPRSKDTSPAPRETAPAAPSREAAPAPPSRPSVTAEPPRAPRSGGASEGESALPTDASIRRMQATVQGVRVDVETRSAGDQEVVYTVRLLDGDRHALTGMDVSLHGARADGSTVQAAFEPEQPGVYRGRLPLSGEEARDLRLRVVGQGRRFELALGQAVSW